MNTSTENNFQLIPSNVLLYYTDAIYDHNILYRGVMIFLVSSNFYWFIYTTVWINNIITLFFLIYHGVFKLQLQSSLGIPVLVKHRTLHCLSNA